MENSSIDARVSTNNLVFRSGATPVSFEVSIENNSYQFADFHLDLSVPGENRGTGTTKWYRLSPDVASAQPHGSTTTFQVFIIDTPIPGFKGSIDLTVRVFSPQLRQERRLLVRLKIEADCQAESFGVELPVKQFQIYPRNTIDIPVRVRNLGQQFAEIVLRLTGIDPTWLVGGTDRRLTLAAASQIEVVFQCQPPPVGQAPSQNYPFSIEIIGHALPTTGDRQGNIEVLPVGFVKLTIDSAQIQLPAQGKWLPDWKTKTATTGVSFKNGSNIYQQVGVSIQGKDVQKCRAKSLPPAASLNLGTTTKVDLELETDRPWLGWGRTLSLEAKGVLSDGRLGSTDPATQSLTVRVLPIVPLWLQLVSIGLLAAIIGWLLQPRSAAHTDLVNTVRFSGDADTVVSGSNDGTIRRWEVRGDKLEPHRGLVDGIFATPNRGVNVLRFMPEDNNRVAAGLANGVVELFDVANAKKIDDLKVPQADKVFDLVFTQDSKYLFVGHGSGKVRGWNIPILGGKLQPAANSSIDLSRLSQLSFEVHSLAISADRQTLAIGGNFKRFFLWDWAQTADKESAPAIAMQKLEKIDAKLSAGESDYIWALAFVPKVSNVLATADSDGYITIWDLDRCRASATAAKTPVKELNCQESGKIDRWQAGQKAIRSIVFSEDGKLLVSAGDDGKISTWQLSADYKHDPKVGVVSYDNTQKIDSIDLKTTNRGVEIVSGGRDSQVKLQRLK